MRRSRCHLLACALGGWLVLAGATAAPAAAQDAPAEDDAQRRAKALYEQGNTHYDLAEYDQAIELFKQAYALSKRPSLLYNIAQAHRLKGDCQQALNVYKNFLRIDPSNPLRVKVESRIAEMEACLKDPSRKPVGKEAIQPDQGAAPTPESPEGRKRPPEEQPQLGPEPEAARPRGGAKKLLGIVTGAVGVAAIGTGVYFSSVAGDKAETVADACPMADPCDWNDELASVQADGESAESTAIVLYAVGGAAVVGGVVLYWLGAREAKAAPSVAFVPRPGGGGVVATWSF